MHGFRCIHGSPHQFRLGASNQGQVRRIPAFLFLRRSMENPSRVALGRAAAAAASSMAPPRRGGDEEEAEGEEEAAALRAPAHVIARVFSQLDLLDLLSCSRVCKQWYRDSAELREEWRMEYLDVWNQLGLPAKRDPQPQCPTCTMRSLRRLCP